VELSVRAAAAACGERIAVVFEGQTLTYRELAERVARSWAALQARGVKPGSLVAISASNRPETLVALLALIEAGVPFVPVHPRWTEREVQVLLNDAQPAFYLRDADLGESGSAMSAHWPDPPSDDAPLAIIYTSGTTGTPKGAVLQRSAFIASAAGSAQNLGWQDADRWLLCLPLCHIGGLSIVTRCLIARRALILLARYDAQAVLASILRDQATLLSVVPTMLRGLLAADEAGILQELRAVLSGGAATPLTLVEQAVAHGVNVLTTYGLTEACSQVTVQPWCLGPLVRRGSGSPLPGVELSIRDEKDAALPAGAVGRICVRGQTVMRGYLHRPPLLGGWFDTGDLGELDSEGMLHVHARRSDLIVTGGENVYPAEVEQVLEAMPGVARALVFGVPDSTWGQAVAAALVASSGSIDDAALGSWVRTQLATFKRPRLFCQVDAIPELPSGKPDRRQAVRDFTPRLRALQKSQAADRG